MAHESLQNADHEKAANISWLNERFKSGASVWEDEILQKIRTLERPIVIDMHDTLTDSYTTMKANPEAAEAIDIARGIGSVLIVTSATPWDLIQQELKRLNLWREDIVLMDARSYAPPQMSSGTGFSGRYWRNRSETPAYDKTIKEFVETARLQGIECGEDDFYKSAGYKRIAPIFFKPGEPITEIPIIEDGERATENNPGMKGFKVDNWVTSGGGQEGREWERKIVEQEPFWVLDAVKQVKQYYESRSDQVYVKTNDERRIIKCGQKTPTRTNLFGREQLLALDTEGKITSAPITLDEIREMLREETGANLPDEISQQLGFENLNWYMISHPESLATIYFGSSASQQAPSLQTAMATIELSRYIDHSTIDRLGTISSFPDTVFPGYISLAGIHQKMGRIVTARYDTYFQDLKGAQVSLVDDELVNPPKAIDYHVGIWGESFSEIPTSTSDIFARRDDGLITEAMLRQFSPDPKKAVRTLNINGRLFYHQLRYYLGGHDTYLAEQGYGLAVEEDKLTLKGKELKLLLPRRLERAFTPDYPYIHRTGK